MIDNYINYHINRIINATNNLYNEPNSICQKCHNIEPLNCLFCYCPLYETECNGNFIILENGVKDCSNCTIPHEPEFIINYLKTNI